MHAETCPICKGEGRIPDGQGDLDSAWAKPCRGCGGRGWVEVSGERHLPIVPPREVPSMNLGDWRHGSIYSRPDLPRSGPGRVI